MDPRPTLADVAARAGVSKSLVSLVMRGEPGASADTRRRVLEAADQLGYHPDSRARLLRSGRSRLLGVVFGIEHAFHADLVTALYTAARETGYELALSAVTPDRDEAEATAGLLQDRCEALILIGPHRPAAHLARLADRLPVVVLARTVRTIDARASRDTARRPPISIRAQREAADGQPSAAAGAGRSRPVDVVRTADAEGLRRAVDYLVGLGHRRIAHIDGGRAPGATERRRGYRDAMRRHGLVRDIRIIPGGLTEAEGAAAARALLAEETSGKDPAHVDHHRSSTVDEDVAEVDRRSMSADGEDRTDIRGRSVSADGEDRTDIRGRSVSADGEEDTVDAGGRPTAVVVFNDRCATGVLDVFARGGLRVPDDISVIGYDDSHLARLAHINLTTVAQDTATMSRLALARAIDRIEGTDRPRRDAVVPPHLVVRGTTGPPAR